MDAIDWSRSSGAASIACGVLALVWCPGPAIFAGLIFGILETVLNPARGYAITAVVGLSLCGLNLLLFLYHVKVAYDNFPGGVLN